MGARPSQFRKGGGFLNGVDGTITGYTFTDEFNGEPYKAGKDPKTKKDRFHSLFCAMTVRVDGADEDVNTNLFAGSADDFEPSEDGHDLTPAEDGRELGGGTPFARFISSLCDAGFPESALPADSFDFSPIIGTRVRFVQQRDEEATKRLGKQKSKDGKKEYDRTFLVAEQVYDLPKPAGKANSAAKTTSKAKAVEPEEAEIDLMELSGKALREILQRAKKPILKAKLSALTLTTPMLKSHPNKADVRKWVFDDDNLEALAADDVIAYDRETQTLSEVSA